jgi:hypothetical protein
MLLSEWAKAQTDAANDRVVDRENAKASDAVVWYHRGREAALLHLTALLAKYPELDGQTLDEIPGFDS